MQSLNNLSIQGGTEKATYAFSTSFLTNEVLFQMKNMEEKPSASWNYSG